MKSNQSNIGSPEPVSSFGKVMCLSPQPQLQPQNQIQQQLQQQQQQAIQQQSRLGNSNSRPSSQNRSKINANSTGGGLMLVEPLQVINRQVPVTIPSNGAYQSSLSTQIRRPQLNTVASQTDPTDLTPAHSKDSSSNISQLAEASEYFLENFEAPFLFSDLVLETKSRLFHCHRAILSLWSPVFEAMFRNSFKEATTKKIKCAEDSDEEILLLLQHIYTPGGKELSSEISLKLLPVVHRYQVEALLTEIEKRLCHTLTESNVGELLALSDVYQLKDLRQSAVERFSRFEKQRLDQEYSKNNLSSEVQLEICLRRINMLEHVLQDIQRSLSISCVRIESRLDRLPANHCTKHSRPFALMESGDACPACADNMRSHVMDIVRRALNRSQKNSETNTSAPITPGPDTTQSVGFTGGTLSNSESST